MQQNEIILVKFISEIGKGWATAIADSADELDHIKESLKLLTNHISFWIGGSANAAGTIDYSKYMVDETGERIWVISGKKITCNSYDSKNVVNT